MPLIARLAGLTTDDERLEVRLRTEDGLLSIPVELSHDQCHALHHVHAHHVLAERSADVRRPTDLLLAALARAGRSPSSIEIDVDGRLRLRLGPHDSDLLLLDPVDAVALLLRGTLPILVDLPDASTTDWDAALAELVDPSR